MTNITKEYAQKCIRSWMTDIIPTNLGELILKIELDTLLASHSDRLWLRNALLQFFSRGGALNQYMRKVILIATRPEPNNWFLNHRAFVIMDGYDH